MVLEAQNAIWLDRFIIVFQLFHSWLPGLTINQLTMYLFMHLFRNWERVLIEKKITILLQYFNA